MYRPFCVQDNSAAATICSYTPLTSIPLQKHLKYTAKAAEKGRARQGSLPPFRQKFPATALPPVFRLILPVSTTDKLIFESCVLVTYLTSAVALCLPPVLMLIYPSRLARVIFALTDTYHCLNRQTAAHSLDLTNYKLSKYTETFTSPQYRLTYHTIKQAIMHSKVAARSKA